MRAKRRTLTAYLVEPFKQIRFGLHVVIVCFTFVFLLGWLYTNAFREQYQQVIDIFTVVDPTALVENDVFIKNAFIIGGTLAALALTMLFVVIRRTHKMYGPMVSIRRFVGELQQGNYAVRIAIRESDDFQTLVRDLNELAKTLHKRHPEWTGSTEETEDTREERAQDGVFPLEDSEESGQAS